MIENREAPCGSQFFYYIHGIQLKVWAIKKLLLLGTYTIKERLDTRKNAWRPQGRIARDNFVNASCTVTACRPTGFDYGTLRSFNPSLRPLCPFSHPNRNMKRRCPFMYYVSCR